MILSEKFKGFKNDVIFKYVFGNEKKKEILISLLNAILDLKKEKKIKEVKILNPINIRKKIDDKLTILDIKAKDESEKQYNIEMQINPVPSYIERIIFYLDKLYIDQLKEGSDYEDIKKTISISILDFNLLKTEKYHSIFRFKEIENNQELTDIQEIHIIELKKFIEMKKKHFAKDIEKWLFVIKNGEKFYKQINALPAEVQNEEVIIMALKTMKEALSDRRMRELIESREKARLDYITSINYAKREGIEVGIEKGLVEGLEKGRNEILKKIEDVLKAKGMKMKEINEIIKELREKKNGENRKKEIKRDTTRVNK
ncbi:MAG TPA: Rpn family recombination-promoting nuclease/putative transposase [bacterium]|nr:Rpn family recombination-promoting nuclease/putative transposase [bacterium]HPQ17996.1 Rpn family recombination-promoting nuclease/putative transposase [bacterium]